jgi:hypothetical protein
MTGQAGRAAVEAGYQPVLFVHIGRVRILKRMKAIRHIGLFSALFFASLSILLTAGASCARAADADAEVDAGKSSSVQMMERIETIVYGEPNKGGLIERLNSIEKELFGRSLPGSISERHTATLNFLEVGTEDQPSTLFKLGVAEWIVGHAQPRKPALARLETLETDLDGEMQYGKPLAMRVERILSLLVAEPVTFQDVVLPGATVLRLKFLQELSPAKSKKGDFVGLALTDDLFVDRNLVAPKGSLLETYVREVKQPRIFGVPGEVRLDFRALRPLGPQRPPVLFGAASKKATEEAQKGRDKGAGGILGAGAASIGGAIIFGPVGLLGGLLIRGNSIKIPEDTIMFMETSGDIGVSAYPVPESLQIDPDATIRESLVTTTTTTTTTVTTTTVGTAGNSSQPDGAAGGTIELPAEQRID